MGIHSFFHSEFCLTTFPKPPPKRCLHILRSRASSFKWEYPLLSLRLSSSFLRLLPRLLATSISPFILPSITCFRRQFLRKMCPIQLAFRFLISCRIFLCSYIYFIHDTRPCTDIWTQNPWWNLSYHHMKIMVFLEASPCTYIHTHFKFTCCPIFGGEFEGNAYLWFVPKLQPDSMSPCSRRRYSSWPPLWKT